MGWGVPFPTEEGVWGGGGAPSPEIFLIFLVQCVQKIFAFRPSGGASPSVPPALNTPPLLLLAVSFGVFQQHLHWPPV